MNKITINKKILFYFICFLFIIEPKIFTQYGITVLIFAIGNLLIFSYFFVKQINNQFSKMSKLLYLWIFYRIYSLILMIAAGNLNDITNWGYLSLMVSNIIMIFDYSLQNKTSYELLKSISMVGILYLLINLFTLLYFDRGIIPDNSIYANGDGDFYFLGIKVTFTSYVFAFLSIGISYFFISKKKIILSSLVILSSLNLIVSNCTTGIIMSIILLILILFLKPINKINIKMKWLVLFCVAINILFVFFDFSLLFEDVFLFFGKNSTLTGRLDIWTIGREKLLSDPFRMIIGHGLTNDGAWVEFGMGYWQAHNFLLQYLYEEGFLGLILLFTFLCIGDNKLKNLNKKNKKLITVLFLICFVIFIATITNQVFGIAHYYIPFLLVKYFTIYDRMDINE